MDPIADLLVTIKNGYMANKLKVGVPYSKFKYEIVKVLEKENFVGPVQKKDLKIEIELIYIDKKPRIQELRKISKLGLRQYSKSKKGNRYGRGRIRIKRKSICQIFWNGKSLQDNDWRKRPKTDKEIGRQYCRCYKKRDWSLGYLDMLIILTI